MQISSFIRSLVVHVRARRFDVYIGRGGPWGNPFIIGKHGTRKEVVEKYRCWLWSQPQLVAALPSLRGKILGCYCSPHLCHGHILAQLANHPWGGPSLRAALTRGAEDTTTYSGPEFSTT
ncbi:MAG: DUF4326 domain-containing protein [Candidatus Acidiferrales bacterium]